MSDVNIWNAYCERTAPVGDMRKMRVNHTRAAIYRRIKNSPSFREVLIDGMEQGVSITHRQNLSEKRICALPGEHLKHGGIVEFSNHMWLITEVDADNEVYERGLMLQCNHILRWIGKDGKIKEKWCIVVQFDIPRADFSGDFDLAMGDNQTVHAFEAESLAGSCGNGGALWNYTVFGTVAA